MERARIVLRAADGLRDQEIASELGIQPEKAARWRNRFLEGGLAPLRKDAPRPGRPRGATTLFAALDTVDGSVISMCQDRHRHQEWLRFLRAIDSVTPPGKHIHLIADNYFTHKHAKVRKWLIRHPRFHVHFTPTCYSWLDMVERFFRDLTEKRLQRGIFRDAEELITAIGDYVDRRNRRTLDNPHSA